MSWVRVICEQSASDSCPNRIIQANHIDFFSTKISHQAHLLSVAPFLFTAPKPCLCPPSARPQCPSSSFLCTYLTSLSPFLFLLVQPKFHPKWRLSNFCQLGGRQLFSTFWRMSYNSNSAFDIFLIPLRFSLCYVTIADSKSNPAYLLCTSNNALTAL